MSSVSYHDGRPMPVPGQAIVSPAGWFYRVDHVEGNTAYLVSLPPERWRRAIIRVAYRTCRLFKGIRR